jgi:hypothetical protein
MASCTRRYPDQRSMASQPRRRGRYSGPRAAPD